MWVKIKNTYVGKLGTFAAGTVHDLPHSTLMRLPKGTYQRNRMPWETTEKKKKAKQDQK